MNLGRKSALAIAGAAVLLLAGGGAALATAEPPAVEHPAPATVPEKGPFLPACEEEDSDNCIWDATTEGNGEGVSFIAWHGKVYYLQPQVTINGVTSDATLPDGILYCESPLSVGIDTDDKGNEWAGCM